MAQEVSLPADLRQHALTHFNASLFNPTFTLDGNNHKSVSLWTRWQWQNIDTDPTTIFLNYSHQINEKSGFGAGFFQHNTGIFFNTGGVVNYAYELKLNPIIKLAVGANIFGFQQQLADTRFIPDTDVLPFTIDVSDDFILQLAPGFNLSIENFSFSVASENLLDYNVSGKNANTEKSDKIFMGMASYDFPIKASDTTAFLRPSIYLRTLPEEENQIGVNTLYSTKRYWLQLGYNNFYGISGGAGFTAFNRLSLGALIEFGTTTSINSKDASFELVASYFLGNPQNRRRAVVNLFDALDEVEQLDEEEQIATSKEGAQDAKKSDSAQILETSEPFTETLTAETTQVSKKEVKKFKRDSLDQVKKEKKVLAELEKENKRKEKRAKENALFAAAAEDERFKTLSQEEKKKEAAEEIKRAEAIAEAERTKIVRKRDSIELIEKNVLVDSIAKAKEKSEVLRLQQEANKELQASKSQEVVIEEEVVKLQAGEKYEEVVREAGLEPGFYLIANVFGNKKYFDAFMQDLNRKGIEGGSFLRSKNNYNYAYLKKFNTIKEARKARDNKLDGKYQSETWIFRVIKK